MILDLESMFSDDQALTVDVVSTNDFAAPAVNIASAVSFGSMATGAGPLFTFFILA